MIHQKIEGLIIKITPFKEFDKVITLFSPLTGITRIVGKGVRRPRSQRSYHLDLFNYVDVELEGTGRTNMLLYLREIHTKEHHRVIKTNPVRFSCASIIALFLYRMIPEGAPHQAELFELTLRSLQSLNLPDDQSPTQTLFRYLIKAVKLLGHIEHSLPENQLENELLTQLEILDPQFTLQTRRTLSIFSS